MKQFTKRFLSGVLALGIVLAQMPMIPSFATENLSKEAAEAYIAVIENIVAQYGENPDLAVWEPDYEIGLLFSKLIDLDMDGSPELYVYYTPEAEDGLRLYVEEIWTFHDSSAKKIYSYDMPEHWSSAAFARGTYLLPYEGRFIWVQYYYLSHRTHQICELEFFNLQNGTATSLESLNLEIVRDYIPTVSSEYDPNSEPATYIYNINGSEFTENTSIPYDDHPYIYEIELHEEYLYTYGSNPYDLSGKTVFYDYYGFEQDYVTVLPQLQEITQSRFSFEDLFGVGEVTDLFSSLNLPGTMLECYEVAQDFYYVIMEENGVETGYLICAVKENGQVVYKIVHESTEILPEDTLSTEGNSYTFDSNIEIQFDQVKNFKTQEDYVGYFTNALRNITGTSLNDQGKSELALSMQDSIVNFATYVLNLGSGTGEIKEAEVSPLVEKSNGLYQDFVTLLREEQAELNKDLEQTVRVVLQGLDEENWTIYLNPDLIGQLEGNNLQVFLSSGQQGIEVSAEDLESLLQAYDGLFINVQSTGTDQYAISFADNEGNTIEKLENPVKIYLPTNNEFATVMLDYAQGTENWGGQFNASTNTIQFSTIHSGTYMIVDNSVEIHDVSEEFLSMVQFMVSKGFFEVDENGNFNPTGNMDRNDFTKTIVSMFFALDHDLKSSFPDVLEDSPYYSYIASGESKDIVAGYDDGLFHGEAILTEEMAFALIAQTLVDKKGYNYPEDENFYLNSVSGADLGSEWAQRGIALSVRDSIVLPEESVNPTGDISRQDAAVYLYRLFMLLEEKQQINFELVEEITLDSDETGSDTGENSGNSQGMNPIVYLAGGAALGAVAVGGGILYKKRKV